MRIGLMHGEATWRLSVADDSKASLVKPRASAKVDCAISLAMATAKCLYYRLDMFQRPAPAAARPMDETWRTIRWENVVEAEG